MLQVLLCFLTGFTLTVVMWSSSWLVGKAEVTMSVGPLRPPVTGTVGLWVGLRHVNLTYITANLSLNEIVTWNSRMDLVRAHRAALRDGWPWALLSVTAELGGEGSEWRGCLSDGIRQAGLVTFCLLLASMYVWMVWVMLFTVAPELTARPLMLTGLLMALASLVYVISIGVHVPPEFTVGGAVMHLHLGFAWWLTTAIGAVLTLAGAGLLLYNARRPGQLTTFFEIDFGLTSHRSFHPAWSHEPVFAYKQVETYSQYPTSIVRTEDDSTKNSQDSDPGKDGKNYENYKDVDKEKCEEIPHDKMEGDLIQDENLDHNQTHCAPKVQYILETETSHLSNTSLSSQKQLLPHTNSSLTLSCGTLAHYQEHTPLVVEPTTLRRRSPEQTVEQESKQQAAPSGTTGSEPSLSTSATDPSSEEAPPQSPEETTPLKPSVFVRSCRKSLRWSISKAHSKLYPRMSARLTSNSRSRSLAKLMSEQDWHLNTDRVSKEAFLSSTQL